MKSDTLVQTPFQFFFKNPDNRRQKVVDFSQMSPSPPNNVGWGSLRVRRVFRTAIFPQNQHCKRGEGEREKN